MGGAANKVLWYGLKLSLAQISIILQKSVPELKSQLRHVREQMVAEVDSQPIVSVVSVS